MKERIATISIFINIFLAGGKITVGFFSGSAAIMADGIHSFVDIFSSIVSYIGIRVSQRPPDKKHPYGHYKSEVLAGFIIMLILLVTGIGIIYDAYQSFMNPAGLDIGYLAFGVMTISAIFNEVMARIKIHYGKKENSISLISDGFHSRVDVYASLAVLFSLLLSSYWLYADPLLASLIGLYIIIKSFSLGKEAMDSLMDVSAGESIEQGIKDLVSNSGIELLDLKTQRKGSVITANLEISLPSELVLVDAVKESDILREKLMAVIPDLKYVSIQITSHDIETGFYKPTFEKGFGWRNKKELGKGLRPDGHCFCSKCEYEIRHERGIPCSSIKCPKCGGIMSRK
ncbi:MAG: cation diffusion facilitator family transporter [Minisyncoccus archaeiphilus]|uniref:cation diffusion facilitator family transporter n=1 Tax=Minisyncoccus archaeiphilus TaxID=3238481 RepID=UPI002B0A6213|nr:MAG: cation diffusion facilitator family transporter [Candidatus Parcubacteria bacterium]